MMIYMIVICIYFVYSYLLTFILFSFDQYDLK